MTAADYQLTIRPMGGALAVRRITAHPGTLAQEIHRHVRGLLGGNGLTIRLDGLTGTAYRGSAHIADFSLEPATEPPASPPIRGSMWGYTLADIGRLARTACTADRTYSSDMTTRYDTAWSAIALAVCEADEPPARQELVRVGWQAIYADVRAVRHLYGIDRSDASGQVASAQRYAVYWRPVAEDRADERVTEALAVWQVLEVLSDPYRDAVKALAWHGTYQAAAEALGITYVAFRGRMRTARRIAWAAWYAPETPPAVKGTDRRVGAYGRELATHCDAGHEWTPENTRWDRGHTVGGAKVRRCRACERDRSRARRAGAAA